MLGSWYSVVGLLHRVCSAVGVLDRVCLAVGCLAVVGAKRGLVVGARQLFYSTGFAWKDLISGWLLGGCWFLAGFTR